MKDQMKERQDLANVQRPPSYTIVRIKRKRTDEPLDALVVDRPRRKKSKSGLNVFQFAETVEAGAWDDEQQRQEIQNRISVLARESAQKETGSSAATPPSDVVETQHSTTSSALSTPARAPTTSPLRPKSDEPGRQYTIVRPDTDALSDPSARHRTPTTPPKVWSSKELAALREARSSFKLFEAVPSSSSLGTLSSLSPTGATSTDDPEIAKFLPLLQDYLKISDGIPPAESSMSSISTATSKDDGDYVWDVFYKRPTTYQDIFTPSSSVSGNIATLTGVPPELFDYDESDEESDYEDEADEDSNAEDWYTNDYPDEEDERSEDEGSDVFHEDSDYEDLVRGGSEHDWR